MSTEKTNAFVNARISQGRLVSESLTSSPAKAGSGQQQVKLRTDTSSSFALGLDDPVEPKTITVEIQFRVRMTQIEAEKLIVDYEAKHEVQFDLIASEGVTDWMNLPPGALTPYSAMAHDIAIRRAEGTLHDMGLRGATLPRPTSFNGDNEAGNDPNEVI